MERRRCSFSCSSAALFCSLETMGRNYQSFCCGLSDRHSQPQCCPRRVEYAIQVLKWEDAEIGEPKEGEEEGKAPYLYMEVDFKEVTSKKTALIETSNQLRNKVGEAAVILRGKNAEDDALYLSRFDRNSLRGEVPTNLCKR
ncbi:Leucine carboxyl methyltransferase [Arachis hypogaea]|nr:Leucine carboxyl methyltransferase [Arachis hypogaea]